jgi:phosphate transport system substrate-binding protein
MAIKHGRCSNYGSCSLADSRTDIESTDGNFVCTECGKTLREVVSDTTQSSSGKIKKVLLWVLPLTLILIAFMAWKFLNSSDMPPPVPQIIITEPESKKEPAKDVPLNPPNQNSSSEPKPEPVAPPLPIENPKPGVAAVNEEVEKTILRIHGSNTIGAKLAPALVEAFMKEKGYGEIEKVPLGELEVLIKGKKAGSSSFDAIEIKAHGSSTAFDETDKNKKVGLLGGYADIGMSSTSVKNETITKFESHNLGNPTSRSQEHVVALDGLAIIVNPNNPINKLNIDDIKKIFLCEITDWSEVGGNAGAIKLYSRDEQSGTYDTFKHLVLSGKKIECEKNSPNLICFEDSKALASNVASDTNGIGFIGINYTGMAKTLRVSMGSGANAIAPSRFTIKTEDYPLGRRLYLYQTNKPKPLASEFIQFALSDAGQKVVNDSGLIEVSVLTQTEDNENIDTDKQRILNDSSIPNEYKELIKNADRKDTQLNFRFASGTFDLDNKAFRDIGRLAEKLNKNEFQNAKLILIGFADSKGSEALNLKLSKKRADQIKNELVSEGIQVEKVAGFGETRSLLLDTREDNDESLSKNRRVEVWLQR